MAEQADIDELRQLIGETIPSGEDETSSLFTDVQVAKWVDDTTSLNAAAVKGWTAKMAHFANLVNVTDGAASRQLSDLIDNANIMAARFTRLSLGPTAGRARVGKIVRIT